MSQSGLPDITNCSITRGEFLRGALGAGVLAGTGFIPLGSSSSTVAARPRHGGILRVGHVGGGSTETLDPQKEVSTVDSARVTNLFDGLVLNSPDLGLSYELAEAFESAKGGTVWNVKLRPGVTWHDGSPFTADDVIYTLKRIASNRALLGQNVVSLIDLPAVRKLTPLTLQLPLHKPNAFIPSYFSEVYMKIVKAGETDFKHPIGTGPFMYVSFTPGVSSLFKRNPHYWQHGKPYVDELQQLSISDPTARLNALLGGEVDAIENLDFPQAKAEQTAGRIVVLASVPANYTPIYMAATLEPFRDARVRQAMRLLADRPALVQDALDGLGVVGNDLTGKGLLFYDTSLPQRHQDIAAAKSLLKRAGKSDLRVTLFTSSAGPGMLSSATLFAEQAKAAGVTITVSNGPADTYFGTQYLHQAFAQSYWTGEPLIDFISGALTAGAPYNETHWQNPKFQAIYTSLLAEFSQTRQQALFNELQQMLWNDGGYLIWGFYPQLDGLSKKIRGAVANPRLPLGNYDFRDWYFA